MIWDVGVFFPFFFVKKDVASSPYLHSIHRCLSLLWETGSSGRRSFSPRKSTDTLTNAFGNSKKIGMRVSSCCSVYLSFTRIINDSGNCLVYSFVHRHRAHPTWTTQVGKMFVCVFSPVSPTHSIIQCGNKDRDIVQVISLTNDIEKMTAFIISILISWVLRHIMLLTDW